MTDEHALDEDKFALSWKGLLLVVGLGLGLLAGHAQQPTLRSDKSDINFRKAAAFQLQGKYDSALIYFLESKGEEKRDLATLKRIDKRIAECASGKELMKAPRNFIITNLGPQINSEFEDYAPVLTQDEHLMVFTSRRLSGNMSSQKDAEGNYFEDIFFARQESGHWLMAENMGRPVNTPFHDSNLALSGDGKQLYLYTDENAGDMLVSEFVNGQWEPPKRMPSPVNTPYHESSVSVSPDGKRIFVASERPGGRGGSDIYVIEKNQAGQWLPAHNLGLKVNTEWDEDSPFIDSDGQTLYFSSTGHNSMGGYDLFRSKEKEGAWSTPENLGVPINTPGNDSYFVSTYDGKRAYYSSVRDGGFGKEDIYLIALPKELVRAEEQLPKATTSPEMKKEGSQNVLPEYLFVYFEFGSAKLIDNAVEQLATLARQIRSNSPKILIEGHTDNVGAERFNQALSLARARTVASYLQSKGVASSRVEIHGWGTKRPLVSNEDEIEGRALNRRVEIRVIDN